MVLEGSQVLSASGPLEAAEPVRMLTHVHTYMLLAHALHTCCLHEGRGPTLDWRDCRYHHFEVPLAQGSGLNTANLSCPLGDWNPESASHLNHRSVFHSHVRPTTGIHNKTVITEMEPN